MRHLRNLTPTLAALMLLAACTNGESTAEPSPSAAQRESTTSAAPDYTMLGEPQLIGPGRWGVIPFGDPDGPVAVFDVPEGFQGHESWVWTDPQGPGEFAQLASWSPTRVPADPCRATAPSPPLGATTQDFAEAVAAQKRTTTTRPIPVTVGGYEGMYLELTSPRRFDYQACGPDGMQIWDAGDTEGRVLGEPVTDRYWILDVDGQRVVITAMTLPTATSATVDLVTRMVQTADFVTPG